MVILSKKEGVTNTLPLISAGAEKEIFINRRLKVKLFALVILGIKVASVRGMQTNPMNSFIFILVPN
jgi:hypothetical protein